MKIALINENTSVYEDLHGDNCSDYLTDLEFLDTAEKTGYIYNSLKDFTEAFNTKNLHSYSIRFIPETKYYLFGDEDVKIAYFKGGIQEIFKSKGTQYASSAAESFQEDLVDNIAGNAMVYGWYLEITEEEYNLYNQLINSD